jgi:pimeloyl-ACP methyl ester carboxylesterase
VPQIATPAGLTLEYEAVGSPNDPPLLMINGFTTQLISWPRGFCRRLAEGGHYVISFDNRDCGLSSKFDGQGASVDEVRAAAIAGDFKLARRLAAYTFSEMADDGLALLDALGIHRAHVLGVSMGGMIVQTMAIEHPERLLSLTSMMSSTGEPGVGASTPEALEALLAPPPADRDAYIAATERTLIWRSKRYPDVEWVRANAAESFDRCFYHEGGRRHMGALIASGSRAEALTRVQVATLVIHGLDDTLVAPSGGQRTAELIPGAKLLLVPDMGHDRPEALWPELCDAILDHTAEAERRLTTGDTY